MSDFLQEGVFGREQFNQLDLRSYFKLHGLTAPKVNETCSDVNVIIIEGVLDKIEKYLDKVISISHILNATGDDRNDKIRAYGRTRMSTFESQIKNQLRPQESTTLGPRKMYDDVIHDLQIIKTIQDHNLQHFNPDSTNDNVNDDNNDDNGDTNNDNVNAGGTDQSMPIGSISNLIHAYLHYHPLTTDQQKKDLPRWSTVVDLFMEIFNSPIEDFDTKEKIKDYLSTLETNIRGNHAVLWYVEGNPLHLDLLEEFQPLEISSSDPPSSSVNNTGRDVSTSNASTASSSPNNTSREADPSSQREDYPRITRQNAAYNPESMQAAFDRGIKEFINSIRNSINGIDNSVSNSMRHADELREVPQDVENQPNVTIGNRYSQDNNVTPLNSDQRRALASMTTSQSTIGHPPSYVYTGDTATTTVTSARINSNNRSPSQNDTGNTYRANPIIYNQSGCQMSNNMQSSYRNPQLTSTMMQQSQASMQQPQVSFNASSIHGPQHNATYNSHNTTFNSYSSNGQQNNIHAAPTTETRIGNITIPPPPIEVSETSAKVSDIFEAARELCIILRHIKSIGVLLENIRSKGPQQQADIVKNFESYQSTLSKDTGKMKEYSTLMRASTHQSLRDPAEKKCFRGSVNGFHVSYVL